MMNIVIFTPNYDTGGQGWRIKRAMERYQPEFNVYSIHTLTHSFRYPSDVKYEPNLVYDLFAEADVVHMRNGLESLDRLTKRRSPRAAPLGLVLHHHGTRFREEHAKINAMAVEAGARQMASTLDLTMLEPNVEWLPSPFDIGELAVHRPLARVSSHQEPVRIAHAPTNRAVKSTLRVIEAIRNLVKAGYDIEFDLIERVPNDECLVRKAKADIFIDQLELGIGNNALEAFGMSIPVIAGTLHGAVKERMLTRWGSLPFYEANAENLEERLAHLIRSYELRYFWGAQGFEYLSRFHEESIVADQLATIYRAAASGTADVKGDVA